MINLQVKRLILTTGKVYYDLANYRKENERTDTAIIRIEQLYPFPESYLDEIVAQYPVLESVAWCQDEPLNQGAWYSSQHHMRQVMNRYRKGLGYELKFAGREASAAPACGYTSVHAEQQSQLVSDAFNS